MELITPLGKIQVLLDDEPITCSITQLDSLESLCPDIVARYKIGIDYIPDGKEHLISYCLYPSQPVKGYSESGERLECYGYYNDDETLKVSIGIEVDTGYVYNNEGQLVRDNDEYDYDGVFYNSYALLHSQKQRIMYLVSLGFLTVQV